MAKGKYQEWVSENGLIRIKGWACDGLSDEQIAKNIGINVATLYRWKEKYCEICEAIRAGKDVPDRKVENALYESCFDRTIPVKKAFKVKRVWFDENGKRCEEEHIEIAEETVAIPANPRAQEFWLKNRKPDVWKDKQQVFAEDNGPIEFTWANEKPEGET